MWTRAFEFNNIVYKIEKNNNFDKEKQYCPYKSYSSTIVQSNVLLLLLFNLTCVAL